MTNENGGGNTDVKKNTAGNNVDDKTNAQDGGQDDINKKFEELNAKFETLLKESKGKDSKISQLLKEKETQDLASKTEKEQLEFYRNQTAQFERKEAFRTSFKATGLDPDVFMSIVDEKDPKMQAEKFANLLKSRADESAKTALEKYKADELKKLGDKPEIRKKVNTENPNASINQAIRESIGY